jgi:hypothetical protein
MPAPRTVTTLHGTDITLVGMDPSYFFFFLFSIEKSDGITSISDYLRTQTEQVFGVSNEIRVIKNFVNCELYHADNEKKGAAAYSPAGEKLLIHLSNFRPVKRVLDCVRILARCVRRFPRAFDEGDGPDRGPAEQLARSPKVDRIFPPGKQDHVEPDPLAHAVDAKRNGRVWPGGAGATACSVVPGDASAAFLNSSLMAKTDT